MTQETKLPPCPFCSGTVMFRKALWPSEGAIDAIIHSAPGVCGLVEFSDGTADESIIAKWRSRGQPQRPSTVALGDMVYMNEQSPYFADWRGIEMKVVSLRIEPSGYLWASVIEGNPRHRGNGTYDGETTDIEADHLSPVSRPLRALEDDQ